MCKSGNGLNGGNINSKLIKRDISNNPRNPFNEYLPKNSSLSLENNNSLNICLQNVLNQILNMTGCELRNYFTKNLLNDNNVKCNKQQEFNINIETLKQVINFLSESQQTITNKNHLHEKLSFIASNLIYQNINDDNILEFSKICYRKLGPDFLTLACYYIKDLYGVIGENNINLINEKVINFYKKLGVILEELNDDNLVKYIYFEIKGFDAISDVLKENGYCENIIEKFDGKFNLIHELNCTEMRPHFNIYYSKSLAKETLDIIINDLESKFDEIAKIFGLTSAERENLKTDFEIYGDIADFHLNQEKMICFNWIVGNSNENCFIQIVDPQNLLMSSNRDISNGIMTVPIHEFIHRVHKLFHFKMFGKPNSPYWFLEGIAIYFSGQYEMQYKNQVKKYFDSNSKDNVPLDDLFGTDYPTFQIQGEGYTFSASIIDYIVKSGKWGLEKIKEILRNTDVNKSIYDVLGTTKEEFLKNWHSFVYGNYEKNEL